MTWQAAQESSITASQRPANTNSGAYRLQASGEGRSSGKTVPKVPVLVRMWNEGSENIYGMAIGT